MAKTVHCGFCGKELTTGLFKGTAEELEVAELAYITCCADCRRAHEVQAAEEKERFGTKLENYKRSTGKKPKGQELAELYRRDLAEKAAQGQTRCGELSGLVQFYWYTDDGWFAVRETRTGFINSDVSAEDMIKSLEQAGAADTYLFSRDDITRIEYRQVGLGDPLGLFNIAYSFEIRLNDEKVLTYKPCITRTAVLGKGFCGLFNKRSARKKMERILGDFKARIGSDLPIVRVRKFK